MNGSVSNGGAGGSSGVRDRLSEVAIAKKEYEVIIALSDATKEPMKVDSQIQALINKFKAYLFNYQIKNLLIQLFLIQPPFHHGIY